MADKNPGAELIYDDDLKVLIVSTTGKRTVALAKSLMTDISARMADLATNRLLLDLRDAVYEFDLDEMVEAFREITREVEGIQIALVVKTAQRDEGVVMKTTGAAHWNVVRLFHAREAAEAWLRETLIRD